MKKAIIPILITTVLMTVVYFLGFIRGEKSRQEEIESRVETKECYSKEDLEYIIFAGTQK